MIGAPNSLNLNCKVHVMKEAPGPSVSEEIADIFRNYDIDSVLAVSVLDNESHAPKQLNAVYKKPSLILSHCGLTK